MRSDVPDGDADDPETKRKQSEAGHSAFAGKSVDIHKPLTSRGENEALLLSLFTLCRVWIYIYIYIYVYRSAA